MELSQQDKKPEGEKLDEITSEITNIMKLERLAAEATTEADAVRRYDVLIGKIKTHIRSRVKKTTTTEDDEVFENILKKYKDIRLEDVKKEATTYRGSRIIIMMIGNDVSTKSYVYMENYDTTLADMKEQAYARLKEYKIAMYDELKDIISDEFDLHKNMTQKGLTADKLRERYSRGR